MFGYNLKSGLSLLGGLLLWASAPALSYADWLGFRNDLKLPVVVRTLIDTPNGWRQGNVIVLYPGETRWDLVKDINKRLIVVSDPKSPRKPMIQKPVPAPVGGDVLYSIQQRTNPQGGDPITDLIKQPGQRK